MTNERAVVGGNNPPSALDELTAAVDLVFDQGKQWLDGEEVTNDGLAEGVATLLGEVRKATTKVKAAHKTEKEPWLEGGRAVDAKKNDFIKRLDMVADACKAAIGPYQAAKDAAKAKVEEEARAKAAELQKIADDARDAAATDNLEERAKATEAAEEAEKAQKAADKITKQSTNIKSNAGRAITSVTVYDAEISDLGAAAKHYWKAGNLDIFRDAVLAQAKRDVKAGKRDIPGITVTSTKEVR